LATRRSTGRGIRKLQAVEVAKCAKLRKEAASCHGCDGGGITKHKEMLPCELQAAPGERGAAAWLGTAEAMSRTVVRP